MAKWHGNGGSSSEEVVVTVVSHGGCGEVDSDGSDEAVAMA